MRFENLNPSTHKRTDEGEEAFRTGINSLFKAEKNRASGNMGVAQDQYTVASTYFRIARATGFYADIHLDYAQNQLHEVKAAKANEAGN